MFSETLLTKASDLLELCKSKGLTIATAESCTGGLISALLTEVAGSSEVFSRGFVTYSNDAKTKMLAVDADVIEKHGAVSEEVATAMAVGARRAAGVELAVSVTGVAGPGGGTKGKPVGMVSIAVSTSGNVQVVTHYFSGDRNSVRLQSVEAAIEMLEYSLNQSFSSFA